MPKDDKPFQDISKMRSAIKNLLFLAVALESTDKIAKTRNSDKVELSTYVLNQLNKG